MKDRRRVVGIEKDERQLDACVAELQNPSRCDLEFRQGDAYDIPLSQSEVHSFDMVHCRFLLEHVSDPSQVISQFAKALKPGGQVVLLDDDHELLQLSPACDELMFVWTKYWQSYTLLGCDPLVGRRIPELLESHSIAVTRVDTLFYGACHADPLFELVVDNVLNVVESARELLLQNSLLSEDDLMQARHAAQIWRKNRNATVWYSLPMTFGKLKTV